MVIENESETGDDSTVRNELLQIYIDFFLIVAIVDASTDEGDESTADYFRKPETEGSCLLFALSPAK